MKQIKLTEPGKLIIADVKEPQISKPDDVKIKVAYSAINMEDISFFAVFEIKPTSASDLVPSA